MVGTSTILFLSLFVHFYRIRNKKDLHREIIEGLRVAEAFALSARLSAKRHEQTILLEVIESLDDEIDQIRSFVYDHPVLGPTDWTNVDKRLQRTLGKLRAIMKQIPD